MSSSAESENQNQLKPELQMQSVNNIDELVNRFGGQDSNMRMQPTATIVERVDGSSTPTLPQEQQSQPQSNECFANKRSVSSRRRAFVQIARGSPGNAHLKLRFFDCME